MVKDLVRNVFGRPGGLLSVYLPICYSDMWCVTKGSHPPFVRCGWLKHLHQTFTSSDGKNGKDDVLNSAPNNTIPTPKVAYVLLHFILDWAGLVLH